MNSSPLDILAWRETMAEVLAAFRPCELVIVALRLEGLSDTQIGELLDIHRNTVRRRMQKAQERIAREIPEAASLLSGRKRSAGVGLPATDLLRRGWLCEEAPWPESDDELDASLWESRVNTFGPLDHPLSLT